MTVCLPMLLLIPVKVGANIVMAFLRAIGIVNFGFTLGAMLECELEKLIVVTHYLGVRRKGYGSCSHRG